MQMKQGGVQYFTLWACLHAHSGLSPLPLGPAGSTKLPWQLMEKVRFAQLDSMRNMATQEPLGDAVVTALLNARVSDQYRVSQMCRNGEAPSGKTHCVWHLYTAGITQEEVNHWSLAVICKRNLNVKNCWPLLCGGFFFFFPGREATECMQMLFFIGVEFICIAYFSDKAVQSALHDE